jgi:peptidoglycan hydrolase-like amidase
LSGKWAEFMARRGFKYFKILQYYYPGIQILNF